VALYAAAKPASLDLSIVDSKPPTDDEKERVRRACAMRVWFLRLYDGMTFDGMSSHSGRRTGITRWSRKITEAGGSLKDVQVMAGHADLATTQGYIEVNKNAKRKVVNL
jgi:integrase/recombinase XerD